MESLVVDSSIIAASFLESDSFHEIGRNYINLLERGDYIFHLPMLVVVEVVSAISRRVVKNRQALLIRALKSLKDWEDGGKIVLYPLDRDRMYNGVAVALLHRLRGSDALIGSLAAELHLPLRTTDQEMLDRLERASV